MEAARLVAYKSIISAMNKFPNDSELQSQGCICLQSFVWAKEWSDVCSVQPSEILQAGGMEAVAKAMKRFPDLYSIQSRGCGALANMFIHLNSGPGFHFTAPQEKHPETQVSSSAVARFVHQLDGIGMVVERHEKWAT